MFNFICLKFLYIFLFFVIVVRSENKNSELDESYCDGTGWAEFRDEKCFKLFKKPLTRAEAKVACEQEASQLVSIKSTAEQKHLTEYVFDTSGVQLNVWIGAKRKEANRFVWNDGSVIDFSNWSDDSPSDVTLRACVVMQSEFAGKSLNFSTTVTGQWKDINCEQWNYAVCEKLQMWSILKLQQTLLDTRKNLKDSLEQVQSELTETKNELGATKNDLSETKHELSATKNDLSATRNELGATKSELSQTKAELNNKIDDTRRNSVPVGFMYFQLPHEKTPTEIWSLMQWTDVSTTYAGVFFRVNGGDAAAFGQVQEDNAPRIETIISGTYQYIVTSYAGYGYNISVPRSGWSEAFWTGYTNPNGNSVFINFKHSSGEVRPRNMAIRIWKRTA